MTQKYNKPAKKTAAPKPAKATAARSKKRAASEMMEGDDEEDATPAAKTEEKAVAKRTWRGKIIRETNCSFWAVLFPTVTFSLFNFRRPISTFD